MRCNRIYSVAGTPNKTSNREVVVDVCPVHCVPRCKHEEQGGYRRLERTKSILIESSPGAQLAHTSLWRM